ncbi:PAS domain S-box-containing protein [Hydrogenophaga palleronii]|uniref:histidine kinase n=1 Tax=Hydrogenophaga palleronii TaxID=65655 RepID=A0ABU1WR39_9BURK|nr:PAS domain S-box protein [Hydrogenophaga palleronii]MDR7151774.1 PAS domain S-box-containing protein [Hydrogenophaga palleronii]
MARGTAVNTRSRALVSAVMLFTLLAVSVLWWQAERSRDQLREQLMQQAGQRSLHLADAMAGQVGILMSMLDLKLMDLRRDWLRDPAGFDPAVRNVLEILPAGFVSHASVVDADGYVVYNSLGQEAGTYVGDRAHFQAQRAGGDRIHIGKPVASRLTGRWIFIVGRPIMRDGQFAGVIQLMVSSDAVAQKLATLQLSDQDVVSLIHADGTFMARSRANSEAMGVQLTSSRPYVQAPDLPHGIYHVKGQLDDVARTYGWRRITPHPLVVAVGLADASVMLPLSPALKRGRAVTATLAALLFMCGGLISVLLMRVARNQAVAEANEAVRVRLFESSHVPIVVMDARTGRIIDCNQAACRIYGYEQRSDVLGRSPEVFSAPKQYDGTPFDEKARFFVAQAVKKGSVKFDWLHQRPDGTQWDGEVNLMCFESEGWKLLQFTVQDITESRRAERALRDSETRLKEAQRLAHVGSWEHNPTTGVILWSDEIYRIFEVDPATFTVTMESFYSIVHPHDRDWMHEAYQRSELTRQPFDLVFRLLMPDGRVKHVRETGQREFQGERLVRSFGTVQDITQMHQAEEALMRLNEELEQRVAERTREMTVLNRDLEAFAYSVSHDLRTPLRSIDGYASLLDAEFGDQIRGEGRSYLERIQRSARRMGNLITDMLSMAHLSRADLQCERVDLSELARSIMAEIAGGETGRSVEWHIEDGLIVQADAGLMRVVLQNLLGNAWKYTSQTTQARISFTRQRHADGRQEFCVRDNGAGFDMTYAEQLFQPFKRLHAHHEFEGTGVGLATVHRVIERHGGKVRGEGKVREGAVFCFTLPG